MSHTLAMTGRDHDLGNRPTSVLTAAAPLPDQAMPQLGLTRSEAVQLQDAWMRMQRDLLTWSTHSEHAIVPDATHYLQFDRPDVVISAVQSIVDRARP